MGTKSVIEELVEFLERGRAVALATIVSARGSAPRKEPGTKMLVALDGYVKGTIGGGVLEARVVEDAKGAIREGRSRLVSYRLTPEAAGGMGLLCGGEVDVFIDVFRSNPVLVIVGAGHVALPLCRMAKIVGFEVVVLDDREEFANSERFPEADGIVVGDYEISLGGLDITPSTYIVIVTRGHQYDELALRSVISSNAAYIGMIGSKKKVSAVLDRLRADGVSEDLIQGVHAPIGLSIGADTPEEIAVSIMAEIIQVMRKGSKREGVCAE